MTASPAPASTGTAAPVAKQTAANNDPFAFETSRDRLRRRLFETTAELCAARGQRRVVLAGLAADVWPIARQPWLWQNVEVVGVLSNAGAPEFIRGVPVLRVGGAGGAGATCEADAVVVCSEENEYGWFERARVWCEACSRGGMPPGVPIVRPYYAHPSWEPDEVAERRLVEGWGTPREQARWLIANRGERHDATLPMLLPSRTELHLRRYEFAATYTAGKRVADIASGLGYGSRVLMRDGAARSVMGFDLSTEAVAYATARFGAAGVSFCRADGCATGLSAGSIDVVTSFETIEHVERPADFVRELWRILTPGGRVVLSTPNDWGLTAHHVHSFTPETLREVLAERFEIEGWWTQRATTERFERGLPEGIAVRRAAGDAGETLLVVARRR